MIKIVINTVQWTCFISDLNEKEVFGMLSEKELQKKNKKGLRLEKVRKRKDDKLYVKWKGYDNSFNIQID